MARGAGVVALWVGTALLAPRAVRAQAGDARALAEALFREGRRDATAGDYAAACQKFAESQRLDPSTGTLLNLGDCEDHQRHLLAARNYFQTALAQLGASDPRFPRVQERLAVLDARLPRLRIALPPSAPPGIVVTRDGTPVPPEGLGVASPLEPGQHVVAVTAPARRERRHVVVLEERQSIEIVAAPGDAQDTPAPAGPVVASTPPASPSKTPAPSSAPARAVGWDVAGDRPRRLSRRRRGRPPLRRRAPSAGTWRASASAALRSPACPEGSSFATRRSSPMRDIATRRGNAIRPASRPRRTAGRGSSSMRPRGGWRSRGSVSGPISCSLHLRHHLGCDRAR